MERSCSSPGEGPPSASAGEPLVAAAVPGVHEESTRSTAKPSGRAPPRGGPGKRGKRLPRLRPVRQSPTPGCAMEAENRQGSARPCLDADMEPLQPVVVVGSPATVKIPPCRNGGAAGSPQQLVTSNATRSSGTGEGAAASTRDLAEQPRPRTRRGRRSADAREEIERITSCDDPQPQHGRQKLVLKCGWCEKEYGTKRGLEVHLGVKHPVEYERYKGQSDPAPDGNRCQHCNMCYTDCESLVTHTSLRHPLPGPPPEDDGVGPHFDCPGCNSRWQKASSLAVHKRHCVKYAEFKRLTTAIHTEDSEERLRGQSISDLSDGESGPISPSSQPDAYPNGRATGTEGVGTGLTQEDRDRAGGDLRCVQWLKEVENQCAQIVKCTHCDLRFPNPVSMESHRVRFHTAHGDGQTIRQRVWTADEMRHLALAEYRLHASGLRCVTRALLVKFPQYTKDDLVAVRRTQDYRASVLQLVYPTSPHGVQTHGRKASRRKASAGSPGPLLGFEPNTPDTTPEMLETQPPALASELGTICLKEVPTDQEAPTLAEEAPGDSCVNDLPDCAVVATGGVTGWRCKDCGLVLRSYNGLGAHRRASHPSEFHAEVVAGLAAKHARWTPEETYLLATFELGLGASKNRNQDLALLMPGRTVESIKCHRRSLEYRKVLKQLEERPVVSDVPVVVDGQPPSPLVEPSADTQAYQGLVDTVLDCRSHYALSDSDMEVLLAGGLVNRYTQETTLNREEVPKELLQQLIDTEYRASFDLVFSREEQDSAQEPREGSTHSNVRHAEPVGHQAGNRTSADIGNSKDRREIRTHKDTKPRSRKGLERTKRYKEVQKLYTSSKKRCAEFILSGQWAKPRQEPIPLSEQEAFWGPLMETESVQDNRQWERKGPVLHGLCSFISKEEITSALAELDDTAAGLDGIDRYLLRNVGLVKLVAHFNLWLATGISPTEFRKGFTALGEKSGTLSAANHRPITVSTMIARLFHRILAGRLVRDLPLSPRQKAFTKGDGLADNIWLLRSVVRHSQKVLQPLYVTFVDVSKAFDSVSRQSILRAAARLGVPELLLSYVKSLYENDTTRLKVRGRLGRVIQVRRGVRQGDPLSPILFNAVMDLVLAHLDPQVGTDLNGTILNHLAFADDLALLSTTKCGMLRLCAQLETALLSVGLRVNVQKSATMAILADGNRKRWVCDKRPFVKFGGSLVEGMDVDKLYRYLGTGMGSKVQLPSIMAQLEAGLEELSKAPLKPQQRLRLLTDHLLTKLTHRLVLEERVTGVLLRDIDKKVRRAVRGWLRLPHDTAVEFFHARVKDGGLGIVQHTVQVRLARKARIESLVARSSFTEDPAIKWLINDSETLSQERDRLSKPVVSSDVPVNTKTGHQTAVAAGLTRSIDGRGLLAHQGGPNLSGWVRDEGVALSGRNYIGCIGMRANTLYTAGRASRGNRGDSRCSCCGVFESLGHILQVCSKTWAMRGERHNEVASKLKENFERVGYTVFEEPSIKTMAGLRKPDLVVSRGGLTTVIDVTVVSDNADLDLEHERKVTYYDNQEIREFAARLTEVAPSDVSFSALALNWRGAMSRRSFSSMIALGLSPKVCEVLAVVTLERGFQLYVHAQRSSLRKVAGGPTTRANTTRTRCKYRNSGAPPGRSKAPTR